MTTPTTRAQTRVQQSGHGPAGAPRPAAGGYDADPWLTDLTVDQSNPFFYDHPLDHVPGMLLVCAMADAVSDRVDVLAGSRVKWVVNFRVMPELTPRLVLYAAPPENGRHTLRVTQGPAVVSDSWFTLTADPEADRPAAASLPPAPAAEPARAFLVHRTRPENVMLGEPLAEDGVFTAAVLLPEAGHTLASRRPDRRSVKSVVEAGRQFATWLSHRVGGWPDEVQMLWLRLTADLPADLPARLPLALRWRQTRMSDDKARLTFELIAGDGPGTRIGSLVYVSKGLTPKAYRAFRAGAGTAA
ncbi:AfsA-related hotdog domain-containing protein [Streptomyces sp. NPDC093248]|uniref:AfsA-related hotdog domain-containing protein n=1 Tax=Streptomyces sp. NPDC093248 TaxID=3155072 RepID=UPI003444DFC2